MTTLARDRRGATYVEFLVAVIPFFIFILCVFQIALLQFADIAVERAANAAARSAVVVLDDDPQFYGGEARNSAAPGGARQEAIRRGAANVLLSLPASSDVDTSGDLEVTFPAQPGADQVRAAFQPNEMVRVRVSYAFTCGVPLARRIMCREAGADGENVSLLEREAGLPNQGARYTYAGGAQ